MQDSSGSLQKSLQILEGRIAELKTKQIESEASYTEFPSRITAKLLHELEDSIGTLEVERTTLTEQLVADKVISKENFFEKLDLVSFEGRVAANNLIKRLGLHIFVNKLGRTNEMYSVSKNNAIPTLFSEEAKNLLFYLVHEGANIQFEAMQDEYFDLQVIQGELTDVGAILAKTDSWDELPPELLAMWKTRHGVKE